MGEVRPAGARPADAPLRKPPHGHRAGRHRGAPRKFGIGVSTHSPAEARLALEEGADVVFLGPIFETPSKRDFGPPLGPEALAALPPRAEHAGAVFAIGGISEETLERLEPFRDRIGGIAAIRLFQEAEDPRALAERIALL